MALIKNVEHAKKFQMEGLVDYESGKVVSLTLAQEKRSVPMQHLGMQWLRFLMAKQKSQLVKEFIL